MTERLRSKQTAYLMLVMQQLKSTMSLEMLVWAGCKPLTKPIPKSPPLSGAIALCRKDHALCNSLIYHARVVFPPSLIYEPGGKKSKILTFPSDPTVQVFGEQVVFGNVNECFSALLEAEVGGSPEVRSLSPGCPTWQNHYSTKNTKLSQPWWHTFVVSAIQEVGAGESLEHGRQKL
ncbi:hypothetical protein AAY473_030303, partial [Plecturocebus cupreus]